MYNYFYFLHTTVNAEPRHRVRRDDTVQNITAKSEKRQFFGFNVFQHLIDLF